MNAYNAADFNWIGRHASWAACDVIDWGLMMAMYDGFETLVPQSLWCFAAAYLI